MVPAKLKDITVAADLNGGKVTATVETSNDGFRTVASRIQLPIGDGVQTYSLDTLQSPSRAVRVRFELTCGEQSASTPAIDAYRITAEAAQGRP